MNNLIVKLFLANVSLEMLSEAFGYEENDVIHILNNPHVMINEEKELICGALNECMANVFPNEKSIFE